MKLKHDPIIQICTSGNRFGPWQSVEMPLSDFYEKLGRTQRGTESYVAFKKLGKMEQGRRKDVGGFVAGLLRNGERKNTSVINRIAATLDADSIPSGTTDKWISAAKALGASCAIYSTRSHCPEAPRLRFVFPFTVPVGPEEGEAVSRYIASLIDPEMQIFDASTFQPERLMYWPSTCADGEFLFEYQDGNCFNGEKVLKSYEAKGGWQNISLWPRCPGEKNIEKTNKMAQRPEDKGGLVGAFCTAYNILDTMGTFLEGVYEPTDVDDRYTFVGGTSAGGALLYEDGTWLYSWHSTDPASNQLCNAYDLVRIHKFGELDAQADPNTPVNRLPSSTAMRRMLDTDEKVQAILAKERGDKLMRDFAALDVSPFVDEEKARDFLGSLKDKPLITETVRELLTHLGITTKYNLITKDAEITGAPKSWSRENSANNLPVYLLDFLRPTEVRGASKASIEDCLAIITDELRINPVKDMLDRVVWDKEDRLGAVYEILHIEDSLSRTLIRKWFIQGVALACNSEREPYGADGVLVLQGDEGKGKTMFFRRAAIKPRWFAEGVTLDVNSKDSVMKATRAWICELGELDSTVKKEQSALKAFLTSVDDTLRPPYARNPVNRVRRTSFCGTVNPEDYLRDEAGNRRFWTVAVHDIELDTLKSLPDSWFEQLWAQAYAAFKADPQCFRLTPEERRELAKVNEAHKKAAYGEIEVMDILDESLPLENWVWVRASDVASKLPGRISAVAAGKILAKFVESTEGAEARRTKHGWAYKVPLRAITTQVIGAPPVSNFVNLA